MNPARPTPSACESAGPPGHTQTPSTTDHAPSHHANAVRIGCVSYLNSKPLIHGIEGLLDTPEQVSLASPVRFDVPANLLHDLEAGEVDVALCPVIDYHRSAVALEVVPVGGIGCEGSTLTVRLFSRKPIERITAVHADTDSHTSVALLQVLLHAMHGTRPQIIDYSAKDQPAWDAADLSARPEAMLLIGDKVVTDSPKAVAYPHQLDLGEAWHQLTGLPFVFAIWMARKGRDLGDVPQRLIDLRETNLAKVEELAARYAPVHGWPADLAAAYLGRILHYRIGPRELEAMELFAQRAHALGLIDRVRPLILRGDPR